ncbi:hypothetical protein A2U01_0053437, partial [Trifolium medium]|nr:hypothetical protein [Trifolium medium]
QLRLAQGVLRLAQAAAPKPVLASIGRQNPTKGSLVNQRNPAPFARYKTNHLVVCWLTNEHLQDQNWTGSDAEANAQPHPFSPRRCGGRRAPFPSHTLH